MRFVGLLLDAWPGTFRLIEIIREPIDQIGAWRRRNWVTLYTDPMAVTPCTKFNEQAVPFYAYGWSRNISRLSLKDRIIKMLHGLQIPNRTAYKVLVDSNKEQIRVIWFEDFLVDTHNYVDQLAGFLQTKTTKTTKAGIYKQGCPRLQPTNKRQIKFEIIKKEATAPYLDLVDQMIEDYKTDWA